MSSSTELSLGTMTPEFGNSAALCGDFSSEQAALNFQSLRKPSKSSVDLSIPSPPLSPCPSSANSKEDFIDFDTSDIPASPTPISSRGSKGIETIVVLPKHGTDLKQFPLDNFDQKFPMAVNAWSGINSRGFIRQQLDFLNQYKLRTNKVSKNYTYGSNSSHNRKMAPRRVVRTFYNEQSDSDSQFEKVRTRRVVRDSSLLPATSDLETTPASISRPSTPTIKRVRKVVSSPTPQPLNIDWESLPDFSPDVSALPANNTRCLKVEWKGQPMNLSDDPLVDKLHPAEVTLASILRLPCNLYLDSKRRLFMEKVARLKKGLPFRRTDAQKSCRIDVNKASRLFAAFEKIGWLNDDKFGKYLRN